MYIGKSLMRERVLVCSLFVFSDFHLFSLSFAFIMPNQASSSANGGSARGEEEREEREEEPRVDVPEGSPVQPSLPAVSGTTGKYIP